MLKKIMRTIKDLEKLGFINVLLNVLGIIMITALYFVIKPLDSSLIVQSEYFTVLFIVHNMIFWLCAMDLIRSILLVRINMKFNVRFRNYYYARKYQRRVTPCSWLELLLVKFDYKFRRYKFDSEGNYK